MFRIRTELNTDLDPDAAFNVSMYPDSDPDIFMTKIRRFLAEKFQILWSQTAIKTLIKDFQSQVKTIRSSANVG